MTTAPALMRLPDVLGATGHRRSTLYRYISRGLWTSPVKVGDRVSVWPAHETQTLLVAITGGADDEQIRALVTRLHEQRQTDFAEVRSRYLNVPTARGAA